MKRNINQMRFFYPAFTYSGLPCVPICAITLPRQRSTSLQLAKKKQRDSARMAAFMNKKDAQNLPFYSLEHARLQELCYNSLLRMKKPYSMEKSVKSQCSQGKQGEISQVSVLHTQTVQELESKIKALEEDSTTYQLANAQLKKENEDLKSKNQELNCVSVSLKSEISMLNEKCADLKSEIKSLQKCNAQLKFESSEVSKIKSERSKLNKEVVDLKTELKNIEKRSLQLQKEKSEIKSTCAKVENRNKQYAEQERKLKKSKAEAECEAKRLDNDLECLFKIYENLNYVYRDCKELSVNLLKEIHITALRNIMSQQNGGCLRCSTSHKLPDNCPANDWYCCRCEQTGHFASSCKSAPLIPQYCINGADEALLNHLEKKFSCQN